MSTPTSSAPPATIEAAPANHKGVGRRPNDNRTHQPATNIVGPAKAHSTPQADSPARMEVSQQELEAVLAQVRETLWEQDYAKLKAVIETLAYGKWWPQPRR